jgi:hypothetical protein
MEESSIDIKDGPARCKKCGHEFASYKIVSIDGKQQILIDQDGDIVFELEKTCHFCETVFPWHSNYQTMRETTKAFTKLRASLNAMHEHQVELEKNDIHA